MLDITIIREKPEWVKEQMEKLNDMAAKDRIDEIVRLDAERRALLTEVEDLKAARNRVSKEIGRMKDQEAREAKIVEMQGVAAQIDELDEQVHQVEAELDEHMNWVPNLPHTSVPVGPDDSHNIVKETFGELPNFDFTPQAHWDFGPALGILDFERGVKLSGTRFYVLRAAGARLQRALINWMLDLHTTQHGYTEIISPYMVREAIMYGSSQLPKFGENLYRDIEEDFYFIPTAEVSLTNLHRDEILEAGQLPIDYVCYTECFRREKMSAGRDVRGMKRGHQFAKVEMYKFTRPEDSYDALEQMVQHAGDVCRALGIPWRIVEMVTGDLGFQATKKYDLEMWAPGCGEWLEVSSLSNCEAFQARRANIRYRPEPKAKPQFVHTLNGSGLALPRVMIAVMENYQQADGSVVVPEALRPYMGGLEVIEAE
ncbi:MAG: serine--tRNA ligase [Anaerolineae bacterium]|nr:serine--tRNA ligase [Anaerolineae bacterium]